MAARQVPVVDRLTTVGEGGERNFLHPATVDGRKTRLRRRIGWVLMALLFVLPFIDIDGTPAIWIDLAHRRVHLFGWHFAPTDSYLLFFLTTAVGFSLIVASALWGRVWCGYACPQTVFLEQLYRPIERWFEGSREQQLRLEKAPWSANKFARKFGKHTAFVFVSVALAHLFIAYFVSPRALLGWMQKGPSAEPGVFIWIVVVSALMFGNYAWFREQLCIVLCPYGRLQSVLSDDDTVVVGYDAKRGEPRGKSSDSGACVDCFRCVAVCPTGIDIRQGMQLECVGCAACIDACDDVMQKLHRPTGLVRYDSLRVLQGEPKRIWRPRLGLYIALMIAGIVAAVVTARAHRPFAVALSRQPGPPFVLDGNEVRNTFVLKAENPTSQPITIELRLRLPEGAKAVVFAERLELAAGELVRSPVVIAAPRSLGGFAFQIESSTDGRVSEVPATFTAP